MGKTNFTFVRPSSMLSAFLLSALFMLAGSTVYGQLACNDRVNVTLDENCVAELPADAVLEGENSPLSGYYVKVAYPNDGHTLDQVVKCGEFKYVVYYINGGADYVQTGLRAEASGDGTPDTEICWGYVNAEDKTDPYGGIDKVIGLTKVQVGSPEAADYYDVATMTPEKRVDVDGNGTKDYANHSPITDLDLNDDDVELLDDPYNLFICTDVPYVYNVAKSWQDPKYAYYTGTPALYDNCSGVEVVRVADEITENECNYTPFVIDGETRLLSTQITRTFYFVDEKGNEGYTTQLICFFKPIIELPPCKEHLNYCEYKDVSESETETALAPLAIESAPFYVNGICEKVYFDDHTCNVTATFEDLVLPGPDGCGFKVIRTWTVLDWCWQPLYEDEGSCCNR